MVVDEIKIVQKENCFELQAEIVYGHHGNQRFNLWYRLPSELREFVQPEGSPFLAATMLPGMALGEDLFINGKVSKKLQDNLKILMDIYRCWDSRLRKIKVEFNSFKEYLFTSPEIGSFFSLGVDSFYTLLKNVEEHPSDDKTITHLIVIQGFDIPLENSDLFNRTVVNAQRVAREFNKRIIPLTTNLRAFSDKIVEWGRLLSWSGHGKYRSCHGGPFWFDTYTIHCLLCHPFPLGIASTDRSSLVHREIIVYS
ncbi:MAG: hypothetical protein AB1638_08115 [Nitrospirota bacterium]